MEELPKTNTDVPEEERKELEKELKESVKIKNTLKGIDTIHPAGMVVENFAIEPIGSGKYIYNLHNQLGEATAEINYETKKWFIKIEGIEVPLDGKPLDKSELVFNMPDKDIVNKLIKGKIEPVTSTELYINTKNYFKRFLDLTEECYYDGLTVAAFQSWLLPVLNSVFFTMACGEFGGGKTVQMSTLKHVCRHGYQPDPSVAFIGRCLDRWKVTPFIDEFDKLGEKDNELYRIVRTAYRRGGTYTRMADKGQRVESFNTFGMIGFTVHGTIEDALQTRSLPLYTTVNERKELPKLGNVRNHIGNTLYNQFFIWYIRNIVDIYNKYVAHVAHVVDIINNNIYGGNDSELLSVIQFESAGNGQHGNTGNHEGRNAELHQVILELLHWIGFLRTGNDLGNNILKSVDRLLELKNEIREELRETGVSGILRDWLVVYYKKHRMDAQYRTENGLFVGANQEIYDGLTAYAKNKGYTFHIPPSEYRGLMRDFGWAKGKNERKMRVRLQSEEKKVIRLAFIYDERIQRNLGIKIEPLKEERTFEDFLDKGVNEITEADDN